MTRIDLARASDIGGQTTLAVCNGRLTLETGVPISTTDQAAKTTLYFTPYLGNQIGTYSGSAWTVASFTEKSISLAGLTADTNYDVFIVDGTLALELLAWTNGTTRATALTTQDGVLVKSGATTRRYLGTIRITATTGQCESSSARRFVWNLYNQVDTVMAISDATASWTYATATWRQANGAAANKIEMVTGIAQAGIRVTNRTRIGPTSTQYGIIGIALNATNTNHAPNGIFIAPNFTNKPEPMIATEYAGPIGLGYSYFAAVEFAGGATVTFFGSGYLQLATVIRA